MRRQTFWRDTYGKLKLRAVIKNTKVKKKENQAEIWKIDCNNIIPGDAASPSVEIRERGKRKKIIISKQTMLRYNLTKQYGNKSAKQT